MGNLGTVLNDPLLLRIGELLLYIWKQVFVHVILINTVQRYFFYFIEQNNSQKKWIIQNRPQLSLMILNLLYCHDLHSISKFDVISYTIFLSGIE